MKATVHILSLDDCGEDVSVTAQGRYENTAQWRGMSRFVFRVPDFVGREYKIGQHLEITINAKRKR